jgi:large subunit ribosomal protein L17
MRHLNKGRKFGLKRGPRRAFLKILAANLITRGKVLTTEARAKEIRPMAERFISYGKKQNVAGLRQLLRKLPRVAAYRVYHELAPKYLDRSGGYTRIVKRAAARKNDGSRMATIEFV